MTISGQERGLDNLHSLQGGGQVVPLLREGMTGK